MSSIIDSPSNRPNGRPEACVPCRRRKVACDHARPVCGRCHRGGKEAECLYASAITASYSLPNTSTDRVSGEGDISLPDTPATGPTFFGFTGHTEIFQETKNYLSQLRIFDTDFDDASISGSTSQCRVNFQDLSPTIRQTCLAILGCVFGPTYQQLLLQNTMQKPTPFSHFAVPVIVDSLHTAFGPHSYNREQDLERIAERICNNTSRPLLDIHTSPKAWMDQFCGPNLRWESLGLLWSTLATLPDAFNTLEDAQLNTTGVKTPPASALSFLARCIELAQNFTEGNDLLINLYRLKETSQSGITGDASLICWVTHAEAVAMMTYLGGHAQKDGPNYKPSLCSEYKRHLFAQVFSVDRHGVAFTGRPPLLHRKYCTTPLPLDLSEEELVADEATFTNAVAALDANGWNTHGGIYVSTFCRARVMIIYLLDEIMELALSPGANPSLESLRALKQREMDTISQFPAGLVYNPQDLADPSIDADILTVRMLLQITHLQNLFLLERLLLRHGAPDEGDLLITTFEIVTLTLTFWTQKDRFSQVRRYFEWLLMAFAAPGGGILCLELLQPTFHWKHPKDDRLTRSSLVQQLSLLVGFFDWVGPSAPNADLCANCKIVIQRVLDYHLNDAMGTLGVLEDFNSGLTGPMNFNFDLLNTFDWLDVSSR
ncbi:Fungal-trans domain-containing protein [Fusarium keratoplasticum]|nr:Fungal-trans domain-containing protein [Fusarium keratoplasticum]